MDAVIDQSIRRLQTSLDQLRSDPELKNELNRGGIDITTLCEQFRRSTQLPATTPAYAAALPMVPVFSVALLVAALVLLVVAAYIISHIKSLKQVILAIMEAVRELTTARAQLKTLPTRIPWKPQCDPFYQHLLEVLGKLIQRFQSPVAQSRPTQAFLKGVGEILEEFTRTLESLVVCQGFDRSSTEWKQLFGQSGLLTIAKKAVERHLRAKGIW